MLLGQTAELTLSDQQVTRLAALARSAESQQTVMRATMDSMYRTMVADRGAPNAPPAMSADTQARMKAACGEQRGGHADKMGARSAVRTEHGQLLAVWKDAISRSLPTR